MPMVKCPFCGLRLRPVQEALHAKKCIRKRRAEKVAQHDVGLNALMPEVEIKPTPKPRRSKEKQK
jgi:hypothetical protein